MYRDQLTGPILIAVAGKICPLPVQSYIILTSFGIMTKECKITKLCRVLWMSTDGAANLGVWSRTTVYTDEITLHLVVYIFFVKYLNFPLGEHAMRFAAIICYFGENVITVMLL